MAELDRLAFPRYDLQTILRKTRIVMKKGGVPKREISDSQFEKIMELCRVEYEFLEKPIPLSVRFFRDLSKKCHLSYQADRLKKQFPQLRRRP